MEWKKEWDPEYGEWERHPVYGIYSRLVYRKIEMGRVLIGREYK